jgi:hypothetical protein
MLRVSSRELSGLPHSQLSYMLLMVLVGGMNTATALKPKEPPAPLPRHARGRYGKGPGRARPTALRRRS